MRPYTEGPSRIRVMCPGCRKRGSVTSRYAGREVRCRRCQECFDVPVNGPYLGVTWPVDCGSEPVGKRPLVLGVAGREVDSSRLDALRLYQG